MFLSAWRGELVEGGNSGGEAAGMWPTIQELEEALGKVAVMAAARKWSTRSQRGTARQMAKRVVEKKKKGTTPEVAAVRFQRSDAQSRYLLPMLAADDQSKHALCSTQKASSLASENKQCRAKWCCWHSHQARQRS